MHSQSTLARGQARHKGWKALKSMHKTSSEAKLTRADMSPRGPQWCEDKLPQSCRLSVTAWSARQVPGFRGVIVQLNQANRGCHNTVIMTTLIAQLHVSCSDLSKMSCKEPRLTEAPEGDCTTMNSTHTSKPYSRMHNKLRNSRCRRE